MNEETFVSNLQKKMDILREGVLLSVTLINKDELNILMENTAILIQKFFSIVNQSSMDFEESILIKTIDPTKLYILIPKDANMAEELAYCIYSKIQLFVDSEFPSSYFKCYVGSIKFSYQNEISADKLISLLNYGVSLSPNNYYYYYNDSPIDIEKLRLRNTNLNLLRKSLIKRKAIFQYQPVIGSESREIEYIECLLRIPDENNNLMSVGDIIQDAEAKGLINIVDFTVVEMVIKKLFSDKNLKLSVNISNIGVLNKRLLKKIEELLSKYHVADRLIIEITETSINKDFVATKKFIDTLHEYGCQFALDDFGSGFTSFKQLLNLPIDIIKIDGSYIRDIMSNKHNKAFVEALINLADDLGIKTVAEFVENGEIARYLTKAKISAMQGDFFCKASDDCYKL